tara:strand:+ start:75 stop:575 length:501 start_codon:yes stop_codon:yes gene_type:complete
MKKSNVIAVDLAKNNLQVCLLDGEDQVINNKSIRASAFTRFLAKQESSIVAFEACSSSHYWARVAQQLGHTAKILPAKLVEQFRQGQKTDANDALAVGIAVRQPNYHTVGIKTVEQQNVQSSLRITAALKRSTNSIKQYASRPAYGIWHPFFKRRKSIKNPSALST